MTKTKRDTNPPPKNKKKRPPRRPVVPPEVSRRRRDEAYQMRLMGMTYGAITQKLNELFPEYPLKSDHQGVEWMIKESQKEYIEDHKTKVDEIKAESAAALDWVRQEAAAAWVRSQDLIKTIKKREDQTVEQVIKAEIGNAQFLKRITETVEVKTKIFGAQAPRKHEVTGKDGAPLVPSVDLQALSKYLSDDDLRVLQQAAEIVERAQRDLAAAVTAGD